jgi:hypothetical protein
MIKYMLKDAKENLIVYVVENSHILIKQDIIEEKNIWII